MINSSFYYDKKFWSVGIKVCVIVENYYSLGLEYSFIALE